LEPRTEMEALRPVTNDFDRDILGDNQRSGINEDVDVSR
jgi:hypothetical protein